MKKINWAKAIFFGAVVLWLTLFSATTLFSFTFQLSGLLGAFLIYTALVSGLVSFSKPSQRKV